MQTRITPLGDSVARSRSEESISGKSVLITGATDGLGKLVAKHLAEQGADVILHGRSAEKGNKVLNDLRSQTGKTSLRYYNGDYASFRNVKALSEEIIKKGKRVDILINNVGIGRGNPVTKREVSEDGLELRFAVNYLSHVLLTEKLLHGLSSMPSQIINVASIGQDPIDFADLMLEKRYEGYHAYKQSKTALIMYTFDLAERLKSSGTNVNAVHPASLMNTKMVTDDWGYTLTTVEDGAEAVEQLLSVPTTGEYYDGKRLSRAIAQAYDTAARTRLHAITWELLARFL